MHCQSQQQFTLLVATVSMISSREKSKRSSSSSSSSSNSNCCCNKRGPVALNTKLANVIARFCLPLERPYVGPLQNDIEAAGQPVNFCYHVRHRNGSGTAYTCTSVLPRAPQALGSSLIPHPVINYSSTCLTKLGRFLGEFVTAGPVSKRS